MSTRELIRSEIDSVPEDRLGELLAVVRQFHQAAPATPTIMAKLRAIRIDGPADFSANLDAYLSGEKRVDDDVP